MTGNPKQSCMIRRFSCAIAAILAFATGHAEEKPLWEFGAGVGALGFPDYRGSDEARIYPIPLPYFVYRGKLFKADREGMRGKLFESPNLDLNISLNATMADRSLAFSHVISIGNQAVLGLGDYIDALVEDRVMNPSALRTA